MNLNQWIQGHRGLVCLAFPVLAVFDGYCAYHSFFRSLVLVAIQGIVGVLLLLAAMLISFLIQGSLAAAPLAG